MFASRKTDTVTLDDGNVVTIRRLNWKAQRDAAAEQMKRQALLSAILNSGLSLPSEALRTALADHDARQKADRDEKQDLSAEKQQAKADQERKIKIEQRYAAFDREIVLKNGVEKWTDEAKLPGGLDDLVESSADKLHRRILDLTLPPIDAATVEDERKNS